MTVPNAIQILSENWGGYVTTSFTSGSDTAKLMFDQDQSTVWSSSGSSDSKAEGLLFIFKDKNGNAAARTLDRIILLNTNIKQMSGGYIDQSGTYNGLTELYISGNSSSNLTFKLSQPIVAKQIYIELQSTFPAGQEKTIGEIKFCKQLMTMNCLSEFSRKDTVQEGSYYLNGGKLVKWSEYRKAGGTISLKNLSCDQRKSLWQAVSAYDFLTFVLFDEFDMSEIFEFAICGGIRETFDRKSRLYTAELEVKER